MVVRGVTGGAATVVVAATVVAIVVTGAVVAVVDDDSVVAGSVVVGDVVGAASGAVVADVASSNPPNAQTAPVARAAAPINEVVMMKARVVLDRMGMMGLGPVVAYGTRSRRTDCILAAPRGESSRGESAGRGGRFAG